MERDAFTSRLGLGQGRIVPQGAVPAWGTHVFVLGEDQPGRIFELIPGDRAEVLQDADLTGIDLVRAHLRLRVPASLPAGLAWEAAIIVDGVPLARARCMPGRLRTITDLAANVSKMNGPHQVGVQLQLTEA